MHTQSNTHAKTLPHTHTDTKGPKYTEILVQSGSIGIRCVGPEPKMIYDPTEKN